MLSRVRFRHHAHRTTTRAEEDAVGTTGCPRASSAGWEGGQDLARRVVKSKAALRLLRPGSPNRVITQDELQIAGRKRPSELSTLGRRNHHLVTLWTSKEDVFVVALHVSRRRVARDVMLRFRVGINGVQQILVRVAPQPLSIAGVDTEQKPLGAIAKDPAVAHANGAGVEKLLGAIVPQDLLVLASQVDRHQCATIAEGRARIFVIVAFPHSPWPVAESPPG
jgi:hypothetical protein